MVSSTWEGSQNINNVIIMDIIFKSTASRPGRLSFVPVLSSSAERHALLSSPPLRRNGAPCFPRRYRYFFYKEEVPSAPSPLKKKRFLFIFLRRAPHFDELHLKDQWLTGVNLHLSLLAILGGLGLHSLAHISRRRGNERPPFLPGLHTCGS